MTEISPGEESYHSVWEKVGLDFEELSEKMDNEMGREKASGIRKVA